jgi:site-specific DNA-cytosine methylase
MPIYEYKGQQYDITTEDPAEAKAKILSYLEKQPQAPAPSLSPEDNVTGSAMANSTGIASLKPSVKPPPAPFSGVMGGDDVWSTINASAESSTPKSVLEKAKTLVPPEDKMLNPEFVNGIQSQLDAMPEADRTKAIFNMMQRDNVYGRAAKVIANRYAALDKTTSETAQNFDPRLEAQTKRMVNQGLSPENAVDYAKQSALSGNLLPSFSQMTEAPPEYAEAEPYRIKGNKTGIEEAGQTLLRGGVKAGLSYEQGVRGVNQFIGDALGFDMSTNKSRLNSINQFTESMGEQSSKPLNLIEGAINSIGQQAPALIGGVLTGSEPAVLGAMFAQSFGQTYDEGARKGLDIGANTSRAAMYAALEVLGEKFGLGDKIKGIKAAANGLPSDKIASFFAHALVKEVPGEELTYAGQFAVDKGYGFNPEAGIAEFISGAADTLAGTIIQGGIMTGAGVAGGKIAEKINNPEKVRARVLADALNEGVQNTKVNQTALDQLVRQSLSPNAGVRQGTNIRANVPSLEVTPPTARPGEPPAPPSGGTPIAPLPAGIAGLTAAPSESMDTEAMLREALGQPPATTLPPVNVEAPKAIEPPKVDLIAEAPKYDTPDLRLKQSDAFGQDLMGVIYSEMESYGRAAIKNRSLTDGYAAKKDALVDAVDAGVIAFGRNDYSVFQPYESVFPKTAAKLKAHIAEQQPKAPAEIQPKVAEAGPFVRKQMEESTQPTPTPLSIEGALSGIKTPKAKQAEAQGEQAPAAPAERLTLDNLKDRPIEEQYTIINTVSFNAKKAFRDGRISQDQLDKIQAERDRIVGEFDKKTLSNPTPDQKQALDLADQIEAAGQKDFADTVRNSVKRGIFRKDSIPFYQEKLQEFQAKQGKTEAKEEGFKWSEFLDPNEQKYYDTFQKTASPEAKAAFGKVESSIQDVTKALNNLGYQVNDTKFPIGLGNLKTQYSNLLSDGLKLLRDHYAIQNEYKRADADKFNLSIKRANDSAAQAQQVIRKAIPRPQEVTEAEQRVSEGEKAVSKIKGKPGLSLWTSLTGKLGSSDIAELFGKSPQIYQKKLQAKKGSNGKSIADMVSDGDLDEFLPFQMRSNVPGFNGQEAEEYIKDQVRGQNYIPYSSQVEIEQIFGSVEEAEKLINDYLTIEEQNLELQEAADEQREAEINARSIEPKGEIPSTEPNEGEALTRPTPEGLRAKEKYRIEQEEKEAAKAKADKEAEDRAKADREVGEFTLTGSNRAADIAVAQGQKDIFAQEEKNEEAPVNEDGVKVVPFEADSKVVGDLLKEKLDEEDPSDIRKNALMHSTEKPAKPKATEMLTPEQAKAQIDEWKAEAKRQGKTSKNFGRTILSLFDASGEWSKPWQEAGYDVHTFDLQTGEDISDFSAEYLLENGYGDLDVWGILAAPPCTDFASSGAQFWAKKDAKGQTEISNELVMQVIRTVNFLQPKIWALENPVGRIAKLNNLPPAHLTFDPNLYGDPYTKKTLLWGNFENELPMAPVEPTEGSKILKLSGKDKYARSLTPEGFAYAFFMVNNAESMTPAERLTRTYYGVDPKAFEGATEADEKAIDSSEFQDFYYDGNLDEAADIARGIIGGKEEAPAKTEDVIQVNGRDIPVTMHRLEKENQLVEVNSSVFDKAFSKTTWQYVGKGGEGGIEGRYKKFAEFIKDARSIEAPNVSVGKDGAIVFGDGRHRYAYLRDSGVKNIPLSMDAESIKNAEKFGYVSKPIEAKPEPVETPEGRNLRYPMASVLFNDGYKVLALNDARTYVDKGGEPHRTFEKDGVRVSLTPQLVLFQNKNAVLTGQGESTDLVINALLVDQAKRNQGKANEALQNIADAADKYGITLYIEPIPLVNIKEKNFGLDRQQLENLYKKFGFDFAEDSNKVMVREPEVGVLGPAEKPAAPRLTNEPTYYSIEGYAEGEQKKRSDSLKRTIKTLNRMRKDGRITDEQFVERADAAIAADEEQRLAEEPNERKRGFLHIQTRLNQAVDAGDMSREARDLATWFMVNNEDLVSDLGISIIGKGKPGQGGQYDAYKRIMTIIKNGGSDLTTVHEILHHLERMMPTKVQQAIRKAWSSQLAKAAKAAKTPNEKLYFAALMEAHYGNGNIANIEVPKGAEKTYEQIKSLLEALQKGGSSEEFAMEMLKLGMIPKNLYEYFNPSEFWAVNGSDIVQSRFDAVRGGVLARLKNWLKELGQKIKSLFGLKSDASIIRALDSLAKSDGKFVTSYMLGAGDYYSIQNYKGNAAPTALWDTVEPSFTDGLIYQVADKQVDTKRVIERINEKVGQIDERLDAYTKETLYHGRSAERIKNFLEEDFRPLLEQMKEQGITVDELEKYLHNRHAEERNEQINKINLSPDVQDTGSGIKTTDAQDYLANLPAAEKAKLERFASKIDDIIAGTQETLVDGGLETQDTIDQWNKTYKHYVPLQRDDLDFVHTGSGYVGGVGTKGGASKRAVGSVKPVKDILANIAIQREKAIRRAEQAKVGRALYALAITSPNPKFWLPVNPNAVKNRPKLIQEMVSLGLTIQDAENLIRPLQTPSIDKTTGLVRYDVNQAQYNSKNVFPVRINGEDRFIIFNPKDERAMRMAMSLKNLDADQLGFVLGNIGAVTRWIASINTQYNPVFGAWNMTRDVQSAAFNLSTTEIAGKEKAVLAGTWPAIFAIWKSLRDEPASSPKEQAYMDLFDQMRLAGGTTGFAQQFSGQGESFGKFVERMRTGAPKEKVNIVEQEMKRLNRGNVMKTAQKLFDWLSDYNDAMENAVRLSAFKVSLDQGLSEQKAASIAKELTVNFNRKGASSPTFQALYAFVNASVQGTDRLIKTLNGPTGKKIIAGGIALGVIQAIALALNGYDDGDPPEFLKDKNFIIPIPFAGNNYIILPMPPGLNVFPGIGRIITEAVLIKGGLLKSNQGLGDKALSIGSLILDSFNPLGAGSFTQMIAPTAFDPLFAIAANKDAFGRPIYKKDMSTQPTPGYERSRPTATFISQGIAEFLNFITSPVGTKHTKGLISPTADEIDYLAGQYFGGVGREVIKGVGSIKATAEGEEVPAYKIPVIGKLYGETKTPAAISAKFYDNVSQMAEYEHEIKKRIQNREPVEEYKKANPESKLWQQANNVENRIAKLNKEKKIYLEKNDKKNAQRIEEMRVKAMRDFNDKVRAAQ